LAIIAVILVIAACIAAAIAVVTTAGLVGRRKAATQIARHGRKPVAILVADPSAYCVAVSPGSKYIVVGSADLGPALTGPPPGAVSVFDAATSKRIAAVRTVIGVGAVAFTRGGHQVLVPGGSIGPFGGCLLSLPSLKPSRVDPKSPVVGFSVSFEGSLARAEWNEFGAGTTRSLGARLPVSLDRTPVAQTGGPVAISPDHKLIAASNEYYVSGYGVSAGACLIYIVDTASGSTIRRIATPQMQTDMAFVPGRSELAGISEDSGVLSVWDYLTGRVLWTSAPSDGRFQSVIVSPSGSRVLACNDSDFKVWATPTGRLLEEVACPSGYPSAGAARESPQRVAYSADGKRILVCVNAGVDIFRAPQ
jgi:WD40 repeat protein